MLEGIRVLSFTHFLQGPSASQLLADLGADVIKIEPPSGAFERSWSGPDAYVNGVSVFFMLANRNVRSISVDLKAPEARAVLDDLVAGADVLIESFRPGAMDRLGLGWERLHELNPRLVYCSLSGYGSDGPYVHRPGQDVLLQALSGLAAGNGRGDGPAVPAGASLVDQHAAVLGAFGILAALRARDASGTGMRVESNLLNAALDLQIEPLGYFLNGFEAQRSPAGVSSRYYKAPYGVFETADEQVCLSLNSLSTLAATFQDDWFAAVGEHASYARRDEVNERIAGHLVRQPLAHWREVFDAQGVWYAPVNEFADVVTDPQVQHNRTTTTFQHPEAGEVTVLAHPVMYDGERPGVRTAPPDLGASTREVLRELGYDDARIQGLVASGAVKEPSTDAVHA